MIKPTDYDDKNDNRIKVNNMLCRISSFLPACTKTFVLTNISRVKSENVFFFVTSPHMQKGKMIVKMHEHISFHISLKHLTALLLLSRKS